MICQQIRLSFIQLLVASDRAGFKFVKVFFAKHNNLAYYLPKFSPAAWAIVEYSVEPKTILALNPIPEPAWWHLVGMTYTKHTLSHY